MIRLATMIVAIGLASFTILNGSQIALFSWSLWGAVQPSEAGWVNRAALAAPSVAGPAAAGTEVRDQIADAIGRAPLSGRNWLTLAGVQMMSGAPAPRIVPSLVMSAVTGPNSLELMAGRGLLGVMIWEALPPERRSGIATDLINAARWGVLGLERAQVVLVMETKPAHVRQDIKKYLLVVEGASDTIIKDLGFPEGTRS